MRDESRQYRERTCDKALESSSSRSLCSSVFVHTTETNVHGVLNGQGIVCKTSPYTITGFPRVATGSATLYHRSEGSENIDAKLIYTLDGGTSWLSFGAYTSIGNYPARYASQSPIAQPALFSPGQTVVPS